MSIALGQEYRLGRKAFAIKASKKMAPGAIGFLAVIVLSLIRPLVLSGLSSGVAAAGARHSASILGQVGLYYSYMIGAIFLVSAVILLIGLFVAWLEYRNYAFRFEEFDLAVRRGVISTETVSIPYRQIQDLNIQRDLIYQILGLSRLVIDSAGHEEKGERNETDIILEPLYKETAEEIRGFLERRIGVQVVIDEKEADREAGAA